MSEKFIPCLSLPDKNSPYAKYFITKSNGGYNTAIKGNNSKGQRNKNFDVLPNCVGWAIGRFHQILQDPTFSKLKAVNAELFIKYADKTLKISNTTPQVGSVIVWEGLGKHPGHVAVVERIVNSTEIVTSESGWSGKDFWITQRKKGKDGNWGQSSAYKFLGFIYNPAPCCQNNIITNTLTNATINTSTISSNTPINTSTVNKNQTVQTAKLKDLKLKGTYIVTADDGLNLRLGAGIDYESILLMPKGTKINNYGFYNAVGSVKWLYVQCVINGKKYLGYCSINYLKKQ